MKTSLLLLFFFMCARMDYAGEIEEYFKEARNKTDQHNLRNVDYVYIINLDQRPEKLEECQRQLEIYDIYPYRFSAVNGWELPLSTINAVGIELASWMNVEHWGTTYLPEGDGTPHHEIIHQPGRTYFSHCMSRGAIGIALSHLSVLQDAYDSGYKTIWVMEDDIFVVRNPHLLSDLIDELDLMVGENGWDVLFTDRDTKNQFGELIPCSSFAWRPNYTS